MINQPNKIGVLLVNLGSPDSPTAAAVSRYLREFLGDPCVITIPWLLRWILVNLIIIPLRKHKTAEAYQSVWLGNDAGSPLIINSLKFHDKIKHKLGDNYKVVMAMRYGKPSLKDAIEQLRLANCEKIILMPLFPQHAEATSGSIILKVLELLKKRNIDRSNIKQSNLLLKPPFFDHPQYIKALATSINQELTLNKPEYILFSYHGLPETQANCTKFPSLKKYNLVSNLNSKLLLPDCYRIQCYTTSKLLAQQLGLNESQYGTSFQSRLGALPWVKPYTDVFLHTLADNGITNLSIVCPSFVADCLETLEEIKIRLQEKWKILSGGNLHVIPCLNDHEAWIDAMASIILE